MDKQLKWKQSYIDQKAVLERQLEELKSILSAN